MTDTIDVQFTADETADTLDSAETAVYVRPKGYVEPHAVAARIGDRDLFVGNYHAAESHPDTATRHRHDREFDAVLSVGRESYPATTHHHPLVDGLETDWREFAAAVETARDLHRADGSLLIHCKAGISRSVAVLATTLAVEEGRSLHDALSLVQEARPHAIPHPALHLLGVIYVAARVAGGENSESEERPE